MNSTNSSCVGVQVKFFLNQIDVVLCVSLCAARERILSNLQKHPVPRSAPEMQHHKAPVAEVATVCLTDSNAAAELLQQDLSILQDQAKYVEIIQTCTNKYFHITHLFAKTQTHT